MTETTGAQKTAAQKIASQIPLLELDLLRTLVAIADTGNFTAAAESVHRTPSAVSMQVKRVEELIGRPVFQRDSRSVTATADGELLLEHGRRLLSLNREIIKQFIKPDVSGVVHLGVPDDMAERSMPSMLRQFGQTHCCVTVDVVVDESARLTERVRQGELDLALVTCSPDEKLDDDLELLFCEKLVWAGARHGVAWEQTPIPISVWEEGCMWRTAGIESLVSIGREYRIAFMSAHISGQRAALLADLAIAPIPRSSCNQEIIELGEEHGLPGLQNYGVALLSGEKLSSPACAAADYLRNSFAPNSS